MHPKECGGTAGWYMQVEVMVVPLNILLQQWQVEEEMLLHFVLGTGMTTV